MKKYIALLLALALCLTAAFTMEVWASETKAKAKVEGVKSGAGEMPAKVKQEIKASGGFCCGVTCYVGGVACGWGTACTENPGYACQFAQKYAMDMCTKDHKTPDDCKVTQP